MKITEIRLTLRDEERLKAFADITFDHCFAVHHIRVVQTEKGLIVSMPSRKLPDGSHRDMAHPTTQECRRMIEQEIFREYEAKVQAPK